MSLLVLAMLHTSRVVHSKRGLKQRAWIWETPYGRTCFRKSAVIAFKSASTACFCDASKAPSSESSAGSRGKSLTSPNPEARGSPRGAARCGVASRRPSYSSSSSSSKSIGTRARPNASLAPRSISTCCLFSKRHGTRVSTRRVRGRRSAGRGGHRYARLPPPCRNRPACYWSQSPSQHLP
jgi:hypothetical protein